MKNTSIDPHKRKLRRLNIGIASAFCLFLGGLAFSISTLTAAPDTEQLPDKTVKGLILSPEKKPIPGAIISIKETTTGTVTDTKGNFVLDLEEFEEATVVVQIAMAGFESKDVVVKTNKLPNNLGKITLQKEVK